jgi:hypothetical protein
MRRRWTRAPASHAISRRAEMGNKEGREEPVERNSNDVEGSVPEFGLAGCSLCLAASDAKTQIRLSELQRMNHWCDPTRPATTIHDLRHWRLRQRPSTDANLQKGTHACSRRPHGPGLVPRPPGRLEHGGVPVCRWYLTIPIPMGRLTEPAFSVASPA